jgi:hypothetical protein
MSTVTPSEPREAAKPAFEDGICGLIRAFNMTNDPASRWDFPAAQKDEATLLIRDLMKLFFHGEIKVHPQAAAFARAHGDGDFQQFMYQAVTKPRRKRKAGGAT